ncbi:MAG: LamG domain-containing protein [Bacteroidota bacterium]
MKTMILKLAVIATLFTVASCQEELPNRSVSNQLSEAVFQFGLPANLTGRTQTTASNVILKLRAANSDKLEERTISLLSFNDGYTSSSILLTPGDYLLEEFVAVDSDNQVLYLAPKAGSQLAAIIEQPLPLSFEVKEDEEVKINVEVIDASGIAAADAGYATFNFTVVETVDFFIGTYAKMPGQPSSLDQPIAASMTISALGEPIYTTTLEAGINFVKIPVKTLEQAGDWGIALSIQAEGYLRYKELEHEFSVAELKSHAKDPKLIFLPPHDNSLVGYFPFDGDATDRSKFGNNGIVTGAQLTVDRFGNENMAYYFSQGDGDYIDIPNADQYQFGEGDYTFSFWFSRHGLNVSALPLYKQNIQIYYYRDLDDATNTPRLIAYSGGESEESGSFISTTTHLEDGAWHHITYTRQGQSFSLYIDGVLIDTVTSEKTINTNNEVDIRLGTHNGISDNYQHSIDDFYIYNRALDSDEVTLLYNNNL